MLVDRLEDGVAVARSSADAPEIDGVVRIDGAGDLRPGTFARALVRRASAHDLAAVLAP